MSYVTTFGLSTQLVLMSAEHVSRIGFQRLFVTNTQVGEPHMRQSTAFHLNIFCGKPDLYFDFPQIQIQGPPNKMYTHFNDRKLYVV